MKNFVLFMLGIMLSAGSAFADTCFIVNERGKVLKIEGDCDERYAPMSTFKIALALMGFPPSALLLMKCIPYGLLKKVMLIGKRFGSKIKLQKAG